VAETFGVMVSGSPSQSASLVLILAVALSACSMPRTPVFLAGLCVFMWIALTSGQTTVSSGTGGRCSYSFVVPEPDLIDTCQKAAAGKIADLRAQVSSLQQQLTSITGGSSARNMTDALNLQFKCDCNNNTYFAFTYRDCQDVKDLKDGGVSGLYEIEPIKSTGQLIKVRQNGADVGVEDEETRYWMTKTWGAITVPCQLDEIIGWTVIMRRSNMNVSFDRDWLSYKNGFGETKTGDFWLGLENVYRITNQEGSGKYALWMVITDGKQVPHVYPYESFNLKSESDDYAIQVDGYHGELRDRLITDRPFVTKDHQNTLPPSDIMHGRINCASFTGASTDLSGGGWWFTNDGKKRSYYYSRYDCGNHNLFATKPKWPTMTNVTSVEMKIRPN